MMDLRAKKTESEREDEEAERLIRESPKQRPPRRDRRRERMDTSEGDKDRDLSLNYKDVGGSACVVRHFVNSTYLRGLAMGRRLERDAVYHGVAPYKEDPGPYPGWGPAHQRDIGERDFQIILKSAENWLQAPVLSRHIEGMLPDTRLRAALDLAIQASPYNRAINPQRYNMLLSRLAERFEEKTDTREARSTCTLPSGRVSAGNPQETDAMTTKLSAEQSKTASGILTKLDETAKEIQASYEKLGLPLKDAKKMVNALDRIADDFEINAFGEESWENRRQEIEDKTAAVYQRDPDESYMDTFQNPHQPHQVDADEPYMDAFSDDDSWSEGE